MVTKTRAVSQNQVAAKLTVANLRNYFIVCDTEKYHYYLLSLSSAGHYLPLAKLLIGVCLLKCIIQI